MKQNIEKQLTKKFSKCKNIKEIYDVIDTELNSGKSLKKKNKVVITHTIIKEIK